MQNDKKADYHLKLIIFQNFKDRISVWVPTDSHNFTNSSYTFFLLFLVIMKVDVVK